MLRACTACALRYITGLLLSCALAPAHPRRDADTAMLTLAVAFVSCVFAGVMTQEITCSQCTYVSSSESPYYDIPLAVEGKESVGRSCPSACCRVFACLLSNRCVLLAGLPPLR